MSEDILKIIIKEIETETGHTAHTTGKRDNRYKSIIYFTLGLKPINYFINLHDTKIVISHIQPYTDVQSRMPQQKTYDLTHPESIEAIIEYFKCKSST